MIVKGADDQLAMWAKQPQTMGRFSVEIYWAEVVTEAAGAEGGRYLARVDESQELNNAMSRIVQLPFKVDLKAGEPKAPGDSSPGTSTVERSSQALAPRRDT